MFWYKIKINDGEGKSYTYVGSSNETFDGLAQKASRGEYIHLTELVYYDRGEVKAWAEWDKSIEPGIYINPAHIYSMMQFKGDPRIIPSK